MTDHQAFEPKNIFCPEGIWTLEAFYQLGEKEHDKNVETQKVGVLAQRLVEVLVLAPAIEIFTICSISGEKRDFNRALLRSKRASNYFLHGLIPYPNQRISDDESDGEYIFVNKAQFENFLTDKPLTESAVSDKGTETSDSYTPAYLELMLKAVKALNLSLDRRLNKDAVIKWLNENWPARLEGKSDRLIESMATLLRRPEDKKGGNTAWNPSKGDTD
jgi:hypothetical protein